MPFTKGHSGNPYGRPVSPRGELNDALMAAIKKVEKKRQVNILEHFIERALKSDVVLIGVMRKLLPDLKSLDALIGVVEDRLSPEEAAKVREAMRRSMGIIANELAEKQANREKKNVDKRK